MMRWVTKWLRVVACAVFGHPLVRWQQQFGAHPLRRVGFCRRCETLWIEATRGDLAFDIHLTRDGRGRIVGFPRVCLKPQHKAPECP